MLIGKDTSTSLRRRIIVPLFFSTGALLAVLTYLTNAQVKDQLVERVELRSHLAANSVSYAIDTVTSEGALHRYVSAIGAQPEIDKIVVVGDDPLRVLASTQHKWRGALIDEVDDPGIRKKLEQAVHSKTSEYDLDERSSEAIFIQPTHMGLLAPGDGFGSEGAILVVLDLRYFHDQLSRQLMNMSASGAAMLVLLTVIIYWLLSCRVLNPIRSIIQAVDRRDSNRRGMKLRGKYRRDMNTEFNVPLADTPDEIGYLAKILKSVFETISQSLKSESAARLEAEQAALTKSQFLATMSHEIRTPMNGLIGVLHLIEGDMPKEKQSLVKTARKSADNLLVLINDILDFSKIEAGKMTLEETEYDALELIEEIADLHAPSALEKGLDFLCVSQPASSYTTMGDPHRIRQIISNLINNAIKFTDKGEIVIRLEVSSTDANQDTLRFEVKDSGIGIPEESRERLFEAFSQVNSSTTRQFGGTGLGLAICEKLIHLMGGKIHVESIEGQGSTFSFEIPRIGHRMVDPEERSSFLPEGMRILIVESNPVLCRHLNQWLSYWNCELTETSDLEAARNHLRSLDLGSGEAYEFIIFDQSSRSLSRQEMMEALGGEALFAKTEIISLHRFDDKIDLLPREQGHYRVRKPIHIAELRKIIFSETKEGGAESGYEEKKGYERFEELRLLLVDDNGTNRMIASNLLRCNHGIVSDEASDGIEAIEYIRDNDYDIIIMDCMMPEMDGYDASKAIRSGEVGNSRRDIPIIALTANAMSGDRERCIEAGMSDYIPKPIDPLRLSDMLAKWSSKRHTFAE